MPTTRSEDQNFTPARDDGWIQSPSLGSEIYISLTEMENRSLSSTSRDSTKRYRDQSFAEDGAEKANCIEKLLVVLSVIITIVFFPVSLFCIFATVRPFERAVIFRNGKLFKNHAFGPGLIFYLPCIDTVRYTDLRTLCYPVPPQEALTKDSLTITVDAIVFYKIVQPVWAVINVANYRKSTQYLAETTLRNAIGTKKLSELLGDRQAVGKHILKQMRRYTKDWGIKIIRVEIKDIHLPLQMQKAMAAEAETSKLTNAKILVARAEIEVTKSLQKATELLMDNPLCMQLRYLQSLHTIAGDKTHTIVFPFSVKTIRDLFKS